MKRHNLLLSLIATVGLAACQTGPPVQSSETSQASQEGIVQLEPGLPTGVHLQAEMQLPEEFDGLATIHDSLRYLVYLPEGYDDDPDREWPLIFFLHGSGDDDYDSTFVLSDGLPAVLLAGEQPENFEFVVISPQAWPGETWWTPDIIPAMGALLDEVAENYRVDMDRVYLTGLSMGGHGSWWLASAYPERFAAMSSISGSGYRTPFMPDAETLCRLSEVPVWAIHGALDQISEPRSSATYAAALEDTCSADVKWTLYEDEGHLGAYERAYRDPALYDWLLEQSK